jgi:hypothetical protein
MSQILPEARHSVVPGSQPSAGQMSLIPEQVSATSQTPAALRHTVAADAGLTPKRATTMAVTSMHRQLRLPSS